MTAWKQGIQIFSTLVRSSETHMRTNTIYHNLMQIILLETRELKPGSLQLYECYEALLSNTCLKLSTSTRTDANSFAILRMLYLHNINMHPSSP